MRHWRGGKLVDATPCLWLLPGQNNEVGNWVASAIADALAVARSTAPPPLAPPPAFQRRILASLDPESGFLCRGGSDEVMSSWVRVVHNT